MVFVYFFNFFKIILKINRGVFMGMNSIFYEVNWECISWWNLFIFVILVIVRECEDNGILFYGWGGGEVLVDRFNFI